MKVSNSAFRAVVVALMLFAPASRMGAQKPPTAGSEDARLTADFEARVKQYLDFREKVRAKPPKPTNDPVEIVSRQKQLANKIRVARARVKQGEIFTPEIAKYFRRQIAASLTGPHGKEILATLRHAEPVKMEFEINQSYPDGVPL